MSNSLDPDQAWHVSLDPDLAQHNVGPEIQTDMVFVQIVRKDQQQTTKFAAGRQRVKVDTL